MLEPSGSAPRAEQLPLKLKIAFPRGLAAVIAGDNQAVIDVLLAIAGRTAAAGVYVLRGPAGVGKSVFLRALVEDASAPASVLDALARANLGDQLLPATAGIGLLALDEVEASAGDAQAEEALFGLLNARHDQRLSTVVALTGDPEFKLKDLRSRLSLAVQLTLKPLAPEAAFAAFVERAERLRIPLSGKVCAYLETRVERNLQSLLALLARIDDSTLRTQRRLTVPLLKELLQDR